MDPSELEDWLQTKDSQTSGFFKGEGATESVGHQSGKHIVDILRRNPEKDMNSYTEGRSPLIPVLESLCWKSMPRGCADREIQMTSNLCARLLITASVIRHRSSIL